jgi:folate-binding protein YgfZ
MVGEDAFDYYRVLNKVPKNPNEINDNYNPHEAGLLKDVSFSKGCYIGQEVIARLDTYDKVQKDLSKVRINCAENINLPAEFFNTDNELVGILTTAVKSLENNHFEGLAFIKRDFRTKNNEMDDISIDNIENKIKLKIVD